MADISLLAYFMAHAPAQPPDWFVPTMRARPVLPELNSIADPALRKEVRDALFNDTDNESPESIAWLSEYAAALERHQEWSREYARETLLQWPRAWAEEMRKRSL